MSSHSLDRGNLAAAQSAPDEREAFEACMRIGGYSNPEKHPDGSYVSSAIELWWQGWKARAAWQRAQSAPAGAVPELGEDSRVPDDYRNQASGYRAGWNDCRAMLSAAPAHPAPHNEQAGEVQRLRDDLVFLADYVWRDCCGLSLPNYLALGRFPLDVAEAALSQQADGGVKS